MRKFSLSIVLMILMLITFASCSEESTTEPPPTITAPMSKLSDIQSKVFNTSCAISGCHGATNTQMNLLLTEGNSHSSMVGVPSIKSPSIERVKPFSSSNSMLIKILKGEFSPRMPLDRDKLPQAVIDSIAKWIDKGALND